MVLIASILIYIFAFKFEIYKKLLQDFSSLISLRLYDCPIPVFCAEPISFDLYTDIMKDLKQHKEARQWYVTGEKNIALNIFLKAPNNILG